MHDTRNPFILFAALLAVNALLAFLSFALGLQNLMAEGLGATLPDAPAWLLGLANAAVIVALYGPLGWLGLWLGRKAGLPGMVRESVGWRRGFVVPLALGMLVGVAIVLLDALFAAAGSWGGFSHPPFPLSLFASATAGIGEEIMFRGFVMGLWAWLAHLVLRRRDRPHPHLALWIGNVIAALAFAAGHLPSVMFLLGAASPTALPPLVLAELVLLNGLVGLICGQRTMRDGLVAAMGVHFWADIVWHVIWPLVAAG